MFECKFYISRPISWIEFAEQELKQQINTLKTRFEHSASLVTGLEKYHFTSSFKLCLGGLTLAILSRVFVGGGTGLDYYYTYYSTVDKTRQQRSFFQVWSSTKPLDIAGQRCHPLINWSILQIYSKGCRTLKNNPLDRSVRWCGV